MSKEPSKDAPVYTTRLAEIKSGRTNLWFIPISACLFEPGFNARGIDYSQDPEVVAKLDPELEPLAKYIAERGIPGVCTGAMMPGKRKFRFTDGHRRTCGVRLAIARKWLSPKDANAQVPVMPEARHYGEDKRLLDMIFLNMGKRLDILEQATVFQRLVEEHHYDESMIVDKTGDSITHVRNCLMLVRGTHPEWLAAIRAGEVAATTVIDYVREVPDLEAQLAGLAEARAKAGEGARITPKDLPVATGRMKRLASLEGDKAEPPTSNIEHPTPNEESESEADEDVDTDSAADEETEGGAAGGGGFEGADPDTPTTNHKGEFVTGVEEFPIDFGVEKCKVKATLLLVEENATHYYGLNLKWPARDGFIHEKPTRDFGFSTRALCILNGLQRLQGELGVIDFPNRDAVMLSLQAMVTKLGEEINPAPHNTAGKKGKPAPSAIDVPLTRAEREIASALTADGAVAPLQVPALSIAIGCALRSEGLLLEWKDAEKSLPDSNRAVLCSDGEGIFLGNYRPNRQEWYADSAPVDVVVLGWMELPEVFTK